MDIKRISIIIIPILLFVGIKLFAQSIVNNPIVIPPSPSVSSFQKFDFSEVNLYNGTPSVQIPIYEIKVGDFSYPIILSYAYNGFKVEEVAGWLGLGWSLSAEGAISRIVRGKPDDSPIGGYSLIRQSLDIPDPVLNPTEFAAFTSTVSNSPNILRQFADGIYDGIPDDYIIKANNLSGSIIELNNGEFVTNPYNPYIITRSTIYNNSYNFWEVTDDSGNKYKFGKLNDQDISGLENYSYEYYDGRQGTTKTESYISNWFIKEIITSSGDKITFNYMSERISKIQTIVESAQILQSIADNDCPQPSNDPSYITHLPINTWKLSSIVSRNAIVYFYSSTPRRDVIDGSNSCSLDSIVIKDHNNVKINKFVFTYSYLGNIADSESCRMILNKVTEQGSRNMQNPPFIFEYNESVSIPSYRSKGIDYWGFYNGSNNQSLIPAEVPYSIHNTYFVGYGNRKPNWNYSSLGLLTKIQTPAKGSTTYTYEPNDCGYIKGEEIPTEPTVDLIYSTTASIPSGSSSMTVSETFSIDDQQIVDIAYSISNNNYPILEYDSVSLTKWRALESEPPIFTIKSNNTSGIKEIELAPGQYKITAMVSTTGHSASIKVTHVKYKKDLNGNIVYNKSLAVGGYRLKKSVHHDGLNQSNDKVLAYEYKLAEDPVRSSGVLYGPLVFEYNVNQAKIIYPQYSPPQDGPWCTFLVRSSSSARVIYGRDGFMGYKYVLVKEGENGENGSTLYQFTTSLDHTFGGSSQSINRSHLRGQIKKVTKMDKTKKILYSKENFYALSHSSNKSGIAGLFLVKYKRNSLINDNLDEFEIPYWGIVYSDWHYLEKSVEENNFDGKIVSNTAHFFYDNPAHAQLTKISKNASNGNLIEEYFYYPLDYPSNIQTLPGVVNSLIQKNMHVKLKEEKKIQGNILDGMVTNYGVGLFPVSMSTLEGGDYFTKIVYDEYDDKGNLLQFHKNNDLNISYYWSYNNNYPVIEATNISKIDLDAKVNLAAVNSGLNTNSWIQNILSEKLKWQNFNVQLRALCEPTVLVTTYTYHPLIGISSATDPTGITTYYEYDSFNRLKFIKDNDDNIVQTYDYNYKK